MLSTRLQSSFIRAGLSMNRSKLLLLVLAIASASIFLTREVAGQKKDGDISPQLVLDCRFNPTICATPTPTPTPVYPPKDFMKGVVMGPITRFRSPDTNGDIGGPDDLLGPNLPQLPSLKPNMTILNESGTGVVRLWADWPTLQPSEADLKYIEDGNFRNVTASDFTSNIVNLEDIESDSRTSAFIANLDAQIIRAKENGLKVILTAYRFPMWATYPHFVFGSNGRDPLFRVPPSLAVNSHWGKWINFLVRRYGLSNETRASKRYIDFLEVCNEPNLQMWPQREDDKINGNLVIARNVARMFRTAQKIVETYNRDITGQFEADRPSTLNLAGPGTADLSQRKAPQKAAKSTGYDIFTRALLKELEGFEAQPFFAWSHHNYTDIEDRREEESQRNKKGELEAPDYQVTNSAAWVRRLLVVGERKGNDIYKWTGWPDKANPALLLTEGGARLNGLVTKYSIPANDLMTLKIKQAQLVEYNFYLMAGKIPGKERLGRGIALVSNYLTYSEPCADTGLFDFTGTKAEFLERGAPKPKGCSNSVFTGEGGGERYLYSTWILLKSS